MVNRRFRTKIPYGFEMMDSAPHGKPVRRRLTGNPAGHNFGKIGAN